MVLIHAAVGKPGFCGISMFLVLFIGSDSGLPRRYSPLDIAALEEVALHHTRTETSYDMGTVNF